MYVDKKGILWKIISDFILVFIAVLVVVFCVPRLIIFFMPIVLGYIISLLVNPIVRFLEERIKIMRKHGSAIVIICVIALVSITLYGIGYILINQVNKMLSELPQLLMILEGKLARIGYRLDGIIDSMPRIIKRYMITLKDGITFDTNILNGSSSIKLAKTTIISVTNMLLYMIFTIMSAYYFTADKDKILCRLRLCMPGNMMAYVRTVMQNFKRILGDYLKVQIKIMVIITVVIYLGLNIFGIKYALIYALVIGVLDLLPFLGTGVILVPWAVGAFILNEIVLGVELLMLYIICLAIREVVEPKMFGKRIGLSAFATFFLLYIGLKLGGVIGAIIAIPIGMIAINLNKAGAFDVLKEDIKYLYREIGKNREEIEKEIRSRNNLRSLNK